MGQLIQSHINFGNKNSLRSHLIRGATGSLILKVTGTGMTMAIAIILARLLGAEGFGIYAFSLSATQILIIPAMLGLEQLMVREVSAYNAKGAFSLMRGLLIRACQSVLGASLLVVVIAGSGAYFVAGHIDALELAVFLPALLLVPLTAFLQVYGSALRGLGKIILGQLPRLVIKNGLFVFFVATFILFFPKHLNPVYAINLQVAATCLAVAFLFVSLVKVLPNQTKQIAAEFKTREWMQSAMPMLLVGGMQILHNETSSVMLGLLGKAENVAFFQVAKRGSDLILFGILAVNMTIAPEISKLYNDRKLEKLQKLLTKSARAVLIFSVPAALFMIVGARWLVPFVFGDEFFPSVLPLILLSFGQLINSAMGSVGILLLMTHNEKLAARGVTIAAVANVSLNALFIPHWGAVGAAIASCISLFIWKGLFAFWAFQRLGLISTAIHFRRSK